MAGSDIALLAVFVANRYYMKRCRFGLWIDIQSSRLQLSLAVMPLVNRDRAHAFRVNKWKKTAKRIGSLIERANVGVQVFEHCRMLPWPPLVKCLSPLEVFVIRFNVPHGIIPFRNNSSSS